MKNIIIALCLFFAFPAFANSKQEKVEELLNLTNTQGSLEASISTAIIPISCTFVMTSEDEDNLKKEFKEAGRFPDLINAMSKFWIDNYTEQELDELLAFYRTKIGKKMARLQPKQAQYSVQELQKWSEQVQPAIYELAKKYGGKYSQRPGNEIQACILSKTMN